MSPTHSLWTGFLELEWMRRDERLGSGSYCNAVMLLQTSRSTVPPGGFLEGGFAEIIAETRRVVGGGGGVVVGEILNGAMGVAGYLFNLFF